MFRIGIDAMGGDYAPEAVVMGAISALDAIGADSRIVLFGAKDEIEAILRREGCPVDKFDIVATSEVITMSDHPAHAFAKKSDSSIVRGFEALARGEIDGFASAGSTGAMMVGSMYAVKPVEGVIRPTISSIIPTVSGCGLLLDVGLNVDCKPEVLYQYGIIGSVYAQSVLGIDNPRVGLLNIGEEREKGNAQAKTTHEMMADNGGQFNFVGNVEGTQLFSGKIADVIVCDGFVGNVVLKQAEGIYHITKKMGVQNAFLDQMNYENVGGTPVLGINAPVIIGHGCSSPLAINSMINQTERTIKADMVNKLKKILKVE